MFGMPDGAAGLHRRVETGPSGDPEMELRQLPETVNGLPNICGAWDQVKEVTRSRTPVYLNETNLHLDQLRAVFAIALHMQQPLIPAGGDIRTADLISNLDFMVRNPG